MKWQHNTLAPNFGICWKQFSLVPKCRGNMCCANFSLLICAFFGNMLRIFLIFRNMHTPLGRLAQAAILQSWASHFGLKCHMGACLFHGALRSYCLLWSLTGPKRWVGFAHILCMICSNFIKNNCLISFKLRLFLPIPGLCFF